MTNQNMKFVNPKFRRLDPVTENLYKVILTVLFMTILFGTAFFIAYASQKKNSEPKNYDECSRAIGSVISKTYPAICTTKNKVRFIQTISEEEQRILESNLNRNSNSDGNGKFCGGIAGIACPTGYTCKLDGNFPDAGGKCVKN